MTVFAKSTKVLEVQHLQAGQGMEERPLALGTLGFWTFFLGDLKNEKVHQEKNGWFLFFGRILGVCLVSFG